ncbi:CCA tRNA nucleotidyltransferase [Clostridium thermarum]|uniref:CCA tRNA nucleotidyltransferase n=1 Tax=Clostridium thermarum TaxID=1716543 RepID=UPI0013D0D6AF|nr:CCA tRNA nucleotidyltransferase [Clostridium thermarum]
MNITIPKKVEYIIQQLEIGGFEAYAVGGCVRDTILGRTPNDWDITTNALPEVIIRTFKYTVPTGIKHGTITVMIENEPFEVTTYRIDGEYTDNRHPDEVIFTTKLEEDLSRRDFTINAIAYNPTNGISDPFNGIKDIKLKIIRTVGNAHDRFNEDALRMIRAIRFSCQLGFHIEEKTFEAIKLNCELIKNVSIERIRDEFSKILLSKRPSLGIENLRLSGLLQYFLPEVLPMVGFDQKNPHHDKDVYHHTLMVIDNTEPRLALRLSALLHDIAKPVTFSIDSKGIGHFYDHNTKGVEMSEYILKKLRYDNDTIKKVSNLVYDHMSRYDNLRNSTIKKIISRVGEENLDDLFNLQESDVLSSAPPFDFSGIDYLKRKSKQILEQRQPLSLKQLAINGSDLIALGVKPGKFMGNVLNHLLEVVLESPELNNKELLKDIAQKYISENEKDERSN